MYVNDILFDNVRKNIGIIETPEKVHFIKNLCTMQFR